MRTCLQKSSPAATVEATMFSRTASLPITASRSTFVVPAGVRAARTLLRRATHQSARRRSFAPTRSVRACAGSGAPSASRRQRLLASSKKVATLKLQETLLQTPGEKVLELDKLWPFVYRKSEKVWVWPHPYPGAASRRPQLGDPGRFGPSCQLLQSPMRLLLFAPLI